MGNGWLVNEPHRQISNPTSYFGLGRNTFKVSYTFQSMPILTLLFMTFEPPFVSSSRVTGRLIENLLD